MLDERKYLRFLIIIFVFLGTLYIFIVPFNFGPDEIAHFDYLRYLSRNLRLPDQSLVKESSPPSDLTYLALSRNNLRDLKPYYEYHQPPLYYISAVPFLRIGGRLTPGQSYLWVRFFSLLLGALTIIFVYKIVCLLTDNLYLRLGAPGVLVALPMFVYLSSLVNNDALANLLSVVIIFLGIRTLKFGINNRIFIFSGIIIGLGILTKVTIYPLAFALFVLLFLKSGKNNFKEFINLVVSPLIVIAGLWFSRNYILYGHFLGLGNFSFFGPDQVAVFNLFTFNEWLGLAFNSFFGAFGSMNLFLSLEAYLAYKIIVLIALIGLFSWLINQWNYFSKYQKEVFAFFLIIIFLVLAGFIYFNLKFFQPQGRYLFPALGIFAIALVKGWHYFLPSRLARGFIFVGFIAMLWINISTILSLAARFL